MGKKSRRKKEKKLIPQIQVEKKPDSAFSAFCLGLIRWSVYLSLFAPLIVQGGSFFPFVGPKSLYFMAFAEIALLGYLFLIVGSPRYRPKINILLLAMILFMVILVLSAIFGVDPQRSFWSKHERMTGVLMWFHLFAFFVVLSSVFSKKDWHRIFEVSMFSAFLAGALSLFSMINAGNVSIASRGGATLGNSSFLATYLLFNFFFGLYLYLKTKGWERVYCAATTLLIAIALFLSTGRAVIVSTVVGLVLLILLYLSFKKKGKIRVLGVSLLVICMIAGVISIVFAFIPGNFFNQKFIQFASYSRFENARMSFRALKERPWLGWGLENFELIFTRFFNPSYFLPSFVGEVWFDRAHVSVFDTLATTGILGLFSYFLVFGAVFWVLWRAYLKHKKEKAMQGPEALQYQKPEEENDFWTTVIFSVFLVAYFLQNFTVFDMISSYLMLFLVLSFVGSIASKRKADTVFKRQRPLNPILALIILILFFCSFFKFVINPYQSGRYVIPAVNATLHRDRLYFSKKALETSPLGKYQIRGFFAEAIVELAQKGPSGNKKATREEIMEGLDFVAKELEKTMEESPLDYRSCLNLGKVYGVYSRYDYSKIELSSGALERAITISPTNQQAYWSLAQTRLTQGRPDDAISLVEKALLLDVRVKKSNIIMVEVAMMIGNIDLAQQKAKEAIEINPSWEEEIESILSR